MVMRKIGAAIGVTLALALAVPAGGARADQPVGGLVRTTKHDPVDTGKDTGNNNQAAAKSKGLSAKVAAAPKALSLAVTGRAQGNTQWCVPASVATTLTHFGVNPSVKTVAAALGQSKPTMGASSLGPARRYLNKRIAGRSQQVYVVTTPTSATDLRNKVVSGIHTWGAPSIGVYPTALLSWWISNEVQGYHALATYGYYDSGNDVRVWDSAWKQRKTMTIGVDYQAMRTAGTALSLKPLLW